MNVCIFHHQRGAKTFVGIVRDAVAASPQIDTSGLAGLLQPRGLYRRQVNPSDIPAEVSTFRGASNVEYVLTTRINNSSVNLNVLVPLRF